MLLPFRVVVECSASRRCIQAPEGTYSGSRERSLRPQRALIRVLESTYLGSRWYLFGVLEVPIRVPEGTHSMARGAGYGADWARNAAKNITLDRSSNQIKSPSCVFGRRLMTPIQFIHLGPSEYAPLDIWLRQVHASHWVPTKQGNQKWAPAHCSGSAAQTRWDNP
jgi:hypothetical protein